MSGNVALTLPYSILGKIQERFKTKALKEFKDIFKDKWISRTF